MSTTCFFVTDLHGSPHRYDALFQAILDNPPDALFMGGDLLPHGLASVDVGIDGDHEFVRDYLITRFQEIKDKLGSNYPEIFLILGNDDNRSWEPVFVDASRSGLWQYCHKRRIEFRGFLVFGYAHVPPTPFLLKDWERYDVSRFVDPGCVSPEEGMRSVPVNEHEIRFSTISNDLAALVGEDRMERAVFLFHTPPYQTLLDRAALDGRFVDHVPLDVHVGSIAVKRFIESRQPLLTLHGHVHESPRLTGSWQDRIDDTFLFSAAHGGEELSLIKFDLDSLEKARRRLL